LQDFAILFIEMHMQNTQFLAFAEHLSRQYSAYRSGWFGSRRFTSEQFHEQLDSLVSGADSRLEIQTVGESFEHRPIRLVSTGEGSTRVLLWSQMHGDEATATMAIFDILAYLSSAADEETTSTLRSALKICFLPMLNPDGAARHQRRTAQGIDMNRDALALCTPEARILKDLQGTLKPNWGFNLHDQELSTIGTSKDVTAIALLAPAFNIEKNDNDVRLRAKRLASVFAQTMNLFVPGKIARYDDAFEPRAFGDNMQKWGTSTMLVESGHASGDIEKESIRRINFIGILTSLYAIATGEASSAELSVYERLPFNGKRAYDVIVRNILIDHGSGRTTPADLGISYQVDTHPGPNPRLVDAGDLHTFTGVREIDGMKKRIPAGSVVIGESFDWEQIFATV
jgi:hypothetical protein